MKKLGRLITFVGVAGAALAGLWYFIDTTKKVRQEEDDTKTSEPEAEKEPRSYVSITPEECACQSELDKESLKKNVTSAVEETIAKAEEVADGIGVVKDQATSDFEFKSFDDKDEEE